MKPLAAEIRSVVGAWGDAEQLADALIEEIGEERWSEESRQIARHWLVLQIRAARRKVPDSRQLDLPGFERVRIVGEQSLDDYRAETARIAARIKSYDYARRSPTLRKEDERMLRERKKLDARIAPYFAADSTMTIAKAIERYRAEMEKPARRQRREARKAKTARTQNQ